MPLVNVNPNQTTTMGSLAEGYRNFATMMAANKQTQNDAASARLNDAKTIAQEFENKGRQSAYDQAMSMMPQQGTQVNTDANGVMTAGDTPWTPEQNNQRLNIRAQAGYLGYGKQTADLFDTNNQGLTTNKFTGDNPYLNQGEQTQMNQQTIGLNDAQMFKDNAAGAKLMSEVKGTDAESLARMALLQGVQGNLPDGTNGDNSSPMMSYEEWVAKGYDPKSYAGITGRWDDDMVMKQTKEFKKEPAVKSYLALSNSLSKVRSAWASGNEEDTNTADQTMLTLYAKIMDEDSAVRGEEVTALINSNGFSAFIRNMSSYFDEEGRLDPRQRDSFRYNAELLADAVKKDAVNIQAGYDKQIAKHHRTGDVIFNRIDGSESEFIRQHKANLNAKNSVRTPGMSDEERWNQLEAAGLSKDEILTKMGAE